MVALFRVSWSGTPGKPAPFYDLCLSTSMPRRVGTVNSTGLAVYENTGGSKYYNDEGKRVRLHGNTKWTMSQGRPMRGMSASLGERPPSPELSDTEEEQIVRAIEASLFKTSPPAPMDVPEAEPQADAPANGARCSVCLTDPPHLRPNRPEQPHPTPSHLPPLGMASPLPWPPPLLQTPVAAAAGAAWNGPARGMGPDEAGRAGRGLGAGWGGTRRAGRGRAQGCAGSRRAAAAQSGAGQHEAEVGQKREGEEVRWG